MPKRKITQVEFAPGLGELGRVTPAKLRVAAYARVSTEKEEQEHSLEAQTDYFNSYIRNNPRWEFVGLYVDDGISGLSHQNRDGFNRMVADALDDKIDLIVTKSLSRFARNTVDALSTIRKLKAANVGVFFQKEDINTLDAKGEFLPTLMSSFAEEESRSISDNITWGKRKQFAPETWNEVQKIFLPDGQRLIKQYPMSGKVVCGACGGRYGRKLWHSTTYRNIVWECNERKKKGAPCKNTHIYAEEMESATAIALQRLYEKNKRIKRLCTELLSAVPLNDREGALTALADMQPQDITFDNSAINVLITKAVVTTDANVVFHFIDGGTYQYRVCGNTPLGQANMNVRKEYHRRIAELYAQGMPSSAIAKTLGIPPNTVRSYIRRSLK